MADPGSAAATRKALGLATLTALVVGNMVGSGVFALPAQLAPFGGASLLGWVVSAGGSMALALVFARLARRSPQAGGPYAYSRDAFGEFTGFLMGWGYWNSCWSALAAIAIAMVGYLGELVPAVVSSPQVSAGTAIAAILILTGVNLVGVKAAGLTQLFTTVLKVLPLLAIAIFGLTLFDSSHFEPFNPTGKSLPLAVHGCLALTLWAFLGLETATIPAGDVRDARRTIPRATILGVGLTALLYVGSTAVVMGLVPREQLATSTKSFADAARMLWGPIGAKIVAAGAFLSCFGALNGWTLVCGQIPMAIANDGLLPPFFAKRSRRGTPTVSLVLSCLFACTLVVTNFSDSLVKMYGVILLLATLSSVVPLVFCTMADLVLAARARREGTEERGGWWTVVAWIAFVYGMLAIASTGKDTVFWGFLLLLAGIPLYVWTRVRRMD